jgi:ABC-type arginine transport system ATPase subunit
MNNASRKWNELSAIEKIIEVKGNGLRDDIFNQAAEELARLQRVEQERDRYRLDLARAIAWIDEQVSFSEADKFAGTTLFETWREVQAALKAG